MYCTYCGKQLSEEAIMCPDCGTPTKSAPSTKAVSETVQTATEPIGAQNSLGVIGFILSTFAFVTGIIFGAFIYVFSGAAVLLIVIGSTTILPALTGISLCILRLKNEKGSLKGLVITGIILAGIALLFLFITACVMASVV